MTPAERMNPAIYVKVKLHCMYNSVSVPECVCVYGIRMLGVYIMYGVCSVQYVLCMVNRGMMSAVQETLFSIQ